MMAQSLACPLYVQEDVGLNPGLLSGLMLTRLIFGKGLENTDHLFSIFYQFFCPSIIDEFTMNN